MILVRTEYHIRITSYFSTSIRVPHEVAGFQKFSEKIYTEKRLTLLYWFDTF